MTILFGSCMLLGCFVSALNIKVALAVYAVLINIVTLVVYWADRVDNGGNDFPEVALVALLFFGGILGAWFGMFTCCSTCFARKSNKTSFILAVSVFSFVNLFWIILW